MMKTSILVTKIFLISLLVTLASSAVFAMDLKVKITTKKPKQGQLHIELYKLSSDLENTVSWLHTVAIASHKFEMDGKENTQFFILRDVELGTICVRSFLDVNSNGILDRSPMGLPREPVGFANNPALVFGEPLPAKACIEVTNESSQLHIKLQQKKRKKP